MPHKVIRSWHNGSVEGALPITEGELVELIGGGPNTGLLLLRKMNAEGWAPADCIEPELTRTPTAPFILSGLYFWVFMVLEPVSTVAGMVAIWFGDTDWFFHSLIPSTSQPSTIDDRTKIALWQLGNCYFLLGLISSLVFPAIRRAIPGQTKAQETIVGASLAALSIADITHVLVTMIGLPEEMRWNITYWNTTTHGNTTFTIVLFSIRVAWFLGFGREMSRGIKQKVNKAQ